MFCKDVRWERWGDDLPPIKIGGFKMLDVICALKKRCGTNRNCTHLPNIKKRSGRSFDLL
jgi:hypothetical protein